MNRITAIASIEYVREKCQILGEQESPHDFFGTICEALSMAIEALQEQERILKQLEELRDEPLMHCSEDYWEGHYIAAKEAIAIVRGEEE